MRMSSFMEKGVSKIEQEFSREKSFKEKNALCNEDGGHKELMNCEIPIGIS